MLSSRHEEIVEMLRKYPESIALMLEVCGARVPKGVSPAVKRAKFTQSKAVEFRADLVVLFGAPKPVLAAVVEDQLGVDKKKLFSWPVYLTVLRSRYQCPAVVMVVAPEQSVARWASQPIDLGNGGSVVPVVIGHGTMPRITDVKVARESPALAMLCAIMYGNDPDSVEIVAASHEAAALFDEERKGYYHELLYSVFNGPARRALEAIMNLPDNYQYQFPPWRAAQAKGKAEAKAQDVLAFLHARGLAIPAAVRDRVLACTDLDVLDQWIARAATCDCAEELFVETRSAAAAGRRAVGAKGPGPRTGRAKGQ